MAKQDIASVLAFEKKLVPSDGYLSGMTWQDEDSLQALALQEKSLRGTISNRLKPAVKNDPAKLNQEVEKPNLQTVDACALKPEHDTLKLQFTLKILGGIENPSACNNNLFQKSYRQAVFDYKAEFAFHALAQRYALNIANARFLWRNRIGAEQIEVKVKALNKGAEQEWQFNSADYDLRDFDNSDDKVLSLATRIASALNSESDFLMLAIDCYAQVGKSQEVYPSEELVFDKGNDKFKKSKILYQVDNQAAMHSQKIGNALRTIDTWYPEHDDPENGIGPIAIEPYGTVTTLSKAFRAPKHDFYTFFDKWARGDTSLSVNEKHYVMAVLVRGGVFGQSK
ncbi:MAG: type I-F CRISPR-associated protein Csy3 [Pseudomonadota bacterium]